MQQPHNASPRRPKHPPTPIRPPNAVSSATDAHRTAASAPSTQARSASNVAEVIAAAFRRAIGERLPGWVFAPLRLFLAVTFMYAGVQKLTDPQFFNPRSTGYIGRQIASIAVGSPIHGLLVGVALPHAQFWGGAIAYGELAIGLGALLGLLLRPAACFGLLLSLLFFLSASWRVRLYFYGADIVFVFGWLTLLLAGPLAGGWPSLDLWLASRLDRWLTAHLAPAQRIRVATALEFVLGLPIATNRTGGETHSGGAEALASTQAPATRGKPSTRARQRARSAQAEVGRRQFVRGALVGGGAMLVVSWLWSLTHPDATTGAATSGGSTGAATGGAPSAAGGSNVIAQVKDVAVNSATSFTIPSNSDPGVLVHLNNGNFVAFDATCTHQGCPVTYDPTSQLLYCPCHGAEFDPAQNAAVVAGPAPTPLTPVSISVNQSTGAVTLQ